MFQESKYYIYTYYSLPGITQDILNSNTATKGIKCLFHFKLHHINTLNSYV